jgi:single-strand DNA-binding protein
MASYNKVILMGNLTRDPQLSYLPSQTAAVDIGLAVNHKYKGNDGQMVEKVCFIDCRAYGRQAETINQYMKKGRPLLVEGRLEFDQWEAQDGSKRSKHRVFIERFTFVDSGQGGGQSGGQASQGGGYVPPQQPPQQQQQPPQQQQQNSPPPNSYNDQGPTGEDIPF